MATLRNKKILTQNNASLLQKSSSMASLSSEPSSTPGKRTEILTPSKLLKMVVSNLNVILQNKMNKITEEDKATLMDAIEGLENLDPWARELREAAKIQEKDNQNLLEQLHENKNVIHAAIKENTATLKKMIEVTNNNTEKFEVAMNKMVDHQCHFDTVVSDLIETTKKAETNKEAAKQEQAPKPQRNQRREPETASRSRSPSPAAPPLEEDRTVHPDLKTIIVKIRRGRELNSKDVLAKLQTRSWGFYSTAEIAGHNTDNPKILELICFTIKDSLVLLQKLSEHQQVLDNCEVYRKPIELQRVLLLGIPQQTQADELVHLIGASLNVAISDVQIITPRQSRTTNKTDWVVAIPRPLADSTLKKGYIQLKDKRFKARPQTTIIRCRNCQGYDHGSAECTNNQVCVRCAGEHHLEICTSEEVCCVHCMNWNSSHATQRLKTNHAADYKKCPIYERKYYDLRKYLDEKYPRQSLQQQNNNQHRHKRNLPPRFQQPYQPAAPYGQFPPPNPAMMQILQLLGTMQTQNAPPPQFGPGPGRGGWSRRGGGPRR